MFDVITEFSQPLRAMTTYSALSLAQKAVEEMINENCDPNGCYGAHKPIIECGEVVGEAYYEYRGGAEIEFGYHFKIGLSTNPPSRLLSLRHGNPRPILLRKVYESPTARNLEAYLHFVFREKHIWGEWFKLSKEDTARIRTHIQKYENDPEIHEKRWSDEPEVLDLGIVRGSKTIKDWSLD